MGAMSQRISVLIADDQHLFAESLRYALHGASDRVEVIGIAGDGEQAVTMTAELKPDAVLMDVRMPVLDGVEATRRIRETNEEVRIVMLTTFDDDEYVHYAIRYGASGYIMKDIGVEELVVSIRAVLNGASLFSRSVTQAVVGEHTVDELRETVEQLSKRERDVLRHIMELRSNGEISKQMDLSQHTVRNYASNLYNTFGVSDRFELIRLLSDHWKYMG